MKNMIPSPNAKSEDVIREVYRRYLSISARDPDLDLGSFLSGAMAVLNEVYPHPDGAQFVSPVVPVKAWLLWTREDLEALVSREAAKGRSS